MDTLPQQVVDGAMAHMNSDHQQNLLDYAQKLAGCNWAKTAVMTTLSSTEFTLDVTGNGRSETVTIPFEQPVTDAQSLRMALVMMAQDTKGETAVQLTASSTVPTAKASRYLKALVNHFSHKVTATYEGNKGEVDFPFGDCTLTATDDALQIHIVAESGSMLERTKYVVADHLIRFGKNETLTVEWKA